MNKLMYKVIGSIGAIVLATLVAACNSPLGSEALSSAKNGSRAIGNPVAPNLGLAASFAVFGGGAGVTNAGTATRIAGDLGTTGASTMITGFHSSTFNYAETPLNVGAITGSVFSDAPQGSPADFAYASSASADALAAFNDLASRPDGIDPGAGQLGGLTLAPGVYKSASGAFLITGSDLSLDAQGNPDAVFIFQMPSSLTVGTATEARSVILLNGAKAGNVFWQVGSAATINGAGGGSMVGTIIASAGMTFSTAGQSAVTSLYGRALSLFASITMVNTVVDATGEPPVAVPVVVTPPTAPVTLTGGSAYDVVAVAGGGFINIENNGGHVAATEVGTGTIAIVNNGGILTATNTGNGLMTITSDATGAVTVTNTGNGRITVNATGAAAVTITHTGDEDFTYPN
jgi:hypothetical protein